MSTLIIKRGADWRRVASFQNADQSAINLTGYTVTAVIRWAAGQQAVTVTVLDAAAGSVRLSLDEAGTAAVPDGRVSRLVITWVSGGGDTSISECDIEGI